MLNQVIQSNLKFISTYFKELYPKVEQTPEEGTIRLCRYDKDLDVIENSFDNCECMFIVTAIRHRPPVTKNEAFLLERKEPKLEFEIYRHDGKCSTL